MPDTDTEAPAEAEDTGPPPDPVRDALVAALRADLGDAVLDSVVQSGDAWIRVGRADWRRAVQVLKERHGFDFFCFLSGIDWLRSPEQATRYEQVFDAPAGSDAAEATGGDEAAAETPSAVMTTGLAGGETRFQVFARFYNHETRIGITVKADLDDADPAVDSLIPLFRGADWHERECWEMFGFRFDGHPDLRHIYLPGEFEGFPLRKDFPLLAREVKPWPGLVDVEPIPGAAGGDDEEGGE